jgi:hypothetical protein
MMNRLQMLLSVSTCTTTSWVIFTALLGSDVATAISHLTFGEAVQVDHIKPKSNATGN